MLDFLLPVWNTFLVHPLINLLVLADYFVHDFGLAVVIVARPQTASVAFADLREAASVALGSVAERVAAG